MNKIENSSDKELLLETAEYDILIQAAEENNIEYILNYKPEYKVIKIPEWLWDKLYDLLFKDKMKNPMSAKEYKDIINLKQAFARRFKMNVIEESLNELKNLTEELLLENSEYDNLIRAAKKGDIKYVLNYKPEYKVIKIPENLWDELYELLFDKITSGPLNIKNYLEISKQQQKFGAKYHAI